jgi:trk system potassium uptake protein TrkH
MIPAGFLLTILLGTALLMLPPARVGPVTAPFLTALFTATSATCVTGLAVVDTASYWSGFGQAVILGLIQIGGLGIMTGATLLGVLISRRLQLSTRLLAQAETRVISAGDVRSLLRLIIVATVAIELLIAAWLAWHFHGSYEESWPTALWNGLFHSISAFNNVGFSTYSDNLMRFVVDPAVLLPIGLAVIVGGLGFPVLYELRQDRWRTRLWSVHTKLTIYASFGLLIVGAVAFLAYEWNNAGTIGPLSVGGKLLTGFFHAIMPRTGGFNSIDIGKLSSESLLVHDALMFIGGGSAGTAGGIKVSTFMVLGLAVWAEVRGKSDVTAFGRRISAEVQRQALAIVVLAVGIVALATIVLLTVTTLSVEVLLFEAISAFATVGLSTGITGSLPPAALWVLIALMFLGRVGTITVATALAFRQTRARYRYPEERPIVG